MKINCIIHIIVLTMTIGFIEAGHTAQNDQTESGESEDSAAPPVSSDRQNSDVEGFVANIGNEIISILVHRSQPLEVRKKTFRSILDRDFDMHSIGKFVISRYWRGMSSAQQEEYLDLFVSAVVESYAAQFDNYNNEKLVVKQYRQSDDGGYVVNSTITRPGKGQPLKVEWKVFKTPRGMKVVDIIVDGVSMSITLRSEYSSVYNDRGGIDGLIGYLREKSSHKINDSE